MKSPLTYTSISTVLTWLVLFVGISPFISVVYSDQTADELKQVYKEDAKALVDDERIPIEHYDDDGADEGRLDLKAPVYESRKYVEDVFNPVLQNASAIEDWVSRYGAPSPTNYHSNGTAPTGSRDKRSVPPLWCDSGYQCSRSLCPWEERLDVQITRTPMIVKYAHCLSSTCNFNFAGLNSDVQRLLNVYTTCDYIRTDIRVKENHREKWLTNWPIACMCTRKRQTAVTPDVTLNRMASDSLSRFASANNVVNVQNNPELERIMQDGLARPTLTRQARRLIRQYQRQQRRRQTTESWNDVMMRRERERHGNHS